MILVSDTGPLIALAKIGQLSLLPSLNYAVVHTPARVRRELLGKIGPESADIDSALATFLSTCEAPDAPEPIRSAIEGLDQGEREVLSLAVSLGESALVLLDDRAGRTAARQLGLRVTGTVGILISTVTYSTAELDAGPCAESPLVRVIREQGVAVDLQALRGPAPRSRFQISVPG